MIHPLTPLSAAEIYNAVQLLKSLPKFRSSTRIISITLIEPLKRQVLAATEQAALPREACAVCFDNARNRAFTVQLNLTNSECIAVTEAPSGSQPTMSLDEQIECEQAVLRSPMFAAALERH